MSAAIEWITVSAPDISCSQCVAAVQKAVGELPGVQTVHADVNTKLVEIAFDPNLVDLSQIEAVMDDAGYPVQR